MTSTSAIMGDSIETKVSPHDWGNKLTFTSETITLAMHVHGKCQMVSVGRKAQTTVKSRSRVERLGLSDFACTK